MARPALDCAPLGGIGIGAVLIVIEPHGSRRAAAAPSRMAARSPNGPGMIDGARYTISAELKRKIKRQ